MSGHWVIELVHREPKSLSKIDNNNKNRAFSNKILNLILSSISSTRWDKTTCSPLMSGSCFRKGFYASLAGDVRRPFQWSMFQTALGKPVLTWSDTWRTEDRQPLAGSVHQYCLTNKTAFPWKTFLIGSSRLMTAA